MLFLLFNFNLCEGSIDKTRRKEAQELEEAGLEPILKHSRWCLLKNKNNQKESQLAKLKELLKYNLKSGHTVQLIGRNDFLTSGWKGLTVPILRR